MSKELEALENIVKHCDYQYCDEELWIINTALEDYELHEKILKDYGFNLANFREACFTLAQFRGEGFTGIEKKLKALEIIKEKKVDTLSILTGACETMEEYNHHHSYIDDKRNGVELLTQEEYDLLKEALS